MSEQAVGPILDGLGISLDLEDGDLVASAVVIAKIVGSDGTVSLFLGESDGLCWIERAGLLAAAENLVEQDRFEPRGEES